MNKIWLIVITIFLLSDPKTVIAQEYVELSVGPDYQNGVFYDLVTDQTTSVNHNDWDLAFTTSPSGAGILYNEASPNSNSGSVPFLRLFLAPTQDFTDTIDISVLSDSIYNGSDSWESGAFNSVADPEDPFDFGWGSYNFNNHSVVGTKVYALQLRDGSWKKIKVESLAGGTYSLRHADLNGENEDMLTISKSEFTDSDLVYYSFESGTAFGSPLSWDLLYTRYRTPLDAGGGVFLQYPVTGILTAPGIEIAEVRDIDPETVNYEDYSDSLKTDLEVIGHDWKSFDLQTFMWQIDPNRVYFVKQPDNHVWKLTFVDFEGATTGTTVLEKTDLGVVTAVKERNSNFLEYGVYPNPVDELINLSFSVKESRSDLPVFIINPAGQKVWNAEVQASAGFNAFQFRIPEITPGVYHIIAGDARDTFSSTIIVK